MKKVIIALLFLFATLGLNSEKASANSLDSAHCSFWVPVGNLYHIGISRYCSLTGWEYIWYN